MAGEHFNFWNGRVAYDVESLLNCISQISDEEFFSYVNQKNDFANWVQGSLKLAELSEKLRPISQRDLIIAVLLDFLDKEKKGLLIGTSRSFNEDELVKEVMEKNNNFLGIKEEQREKIEQNELKDKLKQEEVIEQKDQIIDPIERQRAQREKLALQSSFEKSKEKGSTLTFISLPKRKNKLDKGFFAGLIFGVIIGALLVLIVLRILSMW